MKTIQKLRLINWHYFSNTTTDIKNITFLTGPNGTGKSTIIDALQVLILGTTRPENFNKAANEKGKSGRTLLSYLRGQTGVDDSGNVINLRPGAFTSYLAIEIFDDVANKPFTLGVLFDVDSSDGYDKHFFYLDSGFPENDFSNKDGENDKKRVRPLIYKEFSTYVRNNYKTNHYRFFDSDSDYQAFIKEAFGNLPDKYFSLFKKAVSFAPISDISSFITEYICDSDISVDITPMQKNIEQYKILEIEAKRLHEKADTLTSIHTYFDDFSRHQKSIELLNYVNARVSYDENKKKLDALTDKLKADNNRITEIGDTIARLDSQIEDLRSDYNSYQAKKLQSSSYSLTEKISMKKDSISKSITAITMAISSCMNQMMSYANEYNRVCGDFYSYFSKFDSSRLGQKLKTNFDEIYDLTREIALESKDLIQQISDNNIDFNSLSLFRNDMENLHNKLLSFKSQVDDNIYDLSNELMSLQNDMNAVNAGRKPFESLGPNYIQIKNSLENSLKSRHTDASVDIYCDLVDVNDPEWSMALESVLFSQKFNFFVNPRYYEEANRILKELSDTYHYYRVSLVDTERLLKADIKTIKNSIAELIDTKHEGARAYTDYLLGRTKKCFTFQEARDSGNGLLSDCTGYRGFATWYLNKDNARIFFLGTKVSNDTKALSAADYQKVNTKYSLLNEISVKLSSLLSLPQMSMNELETFKNDINRNSEIETLQASLSNLDQEMQKATNGDMSEVEKKLAEINQNIQGLSKQREDLLTERGTLLGEIERLNTIDIPSSSNMLSKYKEEVNKSDSKKINEEYEPFYNKLLDEQKLTLPQIRVMAQKEYIQSSNKLRVAKDNLVKLRNEYATKYHVSYDVYNETDNSEFDKELENISKVMLPDYEEKIKRAHEQSIKEFKDDFIYKLRTAIENVHAQIDELNQSLADCSFGRDSYYFKVTPSKDYREYYDMIMDPLLLKSGDAEALFMEKYRSTMDTLFSLISSSTSASGAQKEQILRNIILFTSYTTYINFDLLVLRGIGDEKTTISLGRSFKSQSGGETQTPFYIAILASFASLTRAKNASDNNTLRFVIFDEAFSKMDSARIMKSTDLLRQFGLQAILSTPSEKLRDLVNFVDLILVTIHDDKHKKSGLDVYEDKRKKNVAEFSEIIQE